MRANLDLLERSELPGHHCLKCVLSVQYLYVCVCMRVCVCMCMYVSLMHFLCVYMSHCCLRQNKIWRWKHLEALFPHPWKRIMGNYYWTWHIQGWLDIINCLWVGGNRTEHTVIIVPPETVTTLRKQSVKNSWCGFLGCCPRCYLDKYVCAAMTL